MIKATIITIGDEILIGQIVDTNSVSIAKQLNAAGITVAERLSVGDDAARIEESLRHALAQSQVTGGLGPTKDDITKFTLARIFSARMVEDKAVAEHVRTMLARRGIEFNELNRSQALVPDTCTVLPNRHGTAPGMWFETAEGGVVVSLPGVPFEMEHLMQDEVMPRLKHHFSLHANIHRTMITAGLAESMLAARIADWENALPKGIKLAYLPSPNVVRLRLSAYDVEDADATRKTIDNLFDRLYDIIPQYIVGFEDASVQALVHKLLTERGLTLATAESCTGGMLSQRITAVPGASGVFAYGACTYANDIKEKMLGVRHETLEAYGAVSPETAAEMARGVRKAAGADFGVGITGIAGPGGGTPEKPVGLVYLAACSADTVYVQKLVITGRTREVVRLSSTQHALEMVRRLALGLPQPACTAFPAEEPAHLMQKGTPARDV